MSERRQGVRSWDLELKKTKKKTTTNIFLFLLLTDFWAFDIFLFFCFVLNLFFPPRHKKKVRNDMSISFRFFFYFFGRATYRFYIFIGQSRTAHATYNKQVGCSFPSFSSFFWLLFGNFSTLFLFFFAWICCFKCRRATRGGSVKSRRAHQKKI